MSGLVLASNNTAIDLLSEGLSLCVEARKIEDIQMQSLEDKLVGTRSATLQIWALDNYDNRRADWEERVRKHLIAQNRYEDQDTSA